MPTLKDLEAPPKPKTKASQPEPEPVKPTAVPTKEMKRFLNRIQFEAVKKNYFFQLLPKYSKLSDLDLELLKKEGHLVRWHEKFGCYSIEPVA
jgi:hypothetical protein